MAQEFKGSVVEHVDDHIKVHRFSERGNKPVFVVPPHAGRHGNITQNLINTLVARGLTVWAYELLPAEKSKPGLSIYGLVQKLKLCMDLIDEKKVDVLGVCQGGWLSAIYTSLHPENVSRLALFASPINTKTGEKNVIEDYSRFMNMEWHKAVVDFYGGVQPGELQWLAFAFSNPWEVFVKRYMDQLHCALKGDTVTLDKMFRNNKWYDNPITLSGDWFVSAMENHFKNNRLYEETWEVAPGVIPKLSDITCPVFVYAGGSDDITHPEQARGILDRVSSERKLYRVLPDAGHTAVFARPSCIKVAMNDLYGTLN